jgi:hypothetical protein
MQLINTCIIATTPSHCNAAVTPRLAELVKFMGLRLHKDLAARKVPEEGGCCIFTCPDGGMQLEIAARRIYTCRCYHVFSCFSV